MIKTLAQQEDNAVNVKGAADRPLIDLCLTGDLEHLAEHLDDQFAAQTLTEIRNQFPQSAAHRPGDEILNAINKRFHGNFFGSGLSGAPLHDDEVILPPKSFGPR
ncbi:hypothetical protein D3C80_127930 [compost metagenome]